MLRFLKGLFGGLARSFGGLFDGIYRGIMLHLGHDLAAREAEAREAQASRTERKAAREREREAAADVERRHAEMLDATLALLEAVQSGLVPASALPEVARIVDPEAARAERAQARAARAEASRAAMVALFPPRRERPAPQEMKVVSGWPRIVDPEGIEPEVAGYGT